MFEVWLTSWVSGALRPWGTVVREPRICLQSKSHGFFRVPTCRPVACMIASTAVSRQPESRFFAFGLLADSVTCFRGGHVWLFIFASQHLCTSTSLQLSRKHVGFLIVYARFPTNVGPVFLCLRLLSLQRNEKRKRLDSAALKDHAGGPDLCMRGLKAA